MNEPEKQIDWEKLRDKIKTCGPEYAYEPKPIPKNRPLTFRAILAFLATLLGFGVVGLRLPWYLLVPLALIVISFFM